MISVIIPLYNKESTIRETLNSVFCQTFGDWELIVVDDGSNDKSAEIVEAINDDRLKLVRKKNGGPGAARNTGLCHAKGEWTVFLDADDELCKDALANMNKATQEYADADIIDFSRYLRTNNKLRLQRQTIVGRIKNPLRAWFRRQIAPGCGHSIFRTSFARQHPYNPALRRFEDADILLRMLPLAKVYSSDSPTEIHNLDTAAASIPLKDIQKDYVGHLNLGNGGFWYKMCVYRLFVEERENYPADCRRLYPIWYKRYDLLMLYKLLS